MTDPNNRASEVHWRPRTAQLFQRREGLRVRVTACRRYVLTSVLHTRRAEMVTCAKCRAKMSPVLLASIESAA